MGRYIPPASLDRSLSTTETRGFNEDSRKKRGPGGAQTVRFEMPFAIWCTTCQPEAIIGQGIRFNAEKKKVGNYYTTPIWSFRMKHTACSGVIEIRTDPEKREYVVTEGGRRRETGVIASTEGAFGEILTEEERERRRTDAFAQLEGKKTETKVARDENDRVEELLHDRQTHWEDTYTANQRLRKSFRADRKVREANNKVKAGVQEQFSLDVDLLDYSNDDRVKAALVDFDNTRSSDMSTARPIFQDRNRVKVKTDGKTQMQAAVSSNTRALLDPFLDRSKTGVDQGTLTLTLSRLKRKRDASPTIRDGVGDHNKIGQGEELRNHLVKIAPSSNATPSLIDYDSDTE